MNDINVSKLTIQNTNEVAWEHYTAMQSISHETLKDGNYNVEYETYLKIRDRR